VIGRTQMHRLLPFALLAALPASAAAQGWRETAVIVAPHSTMFKIGDGASQRIVSQTAIPFVFVIPFSERISVDLTTAYAISDVITGGQSISAIKGLTDMQVRANIQAGLENMVFTVGLNLPTGQYTIPEGQQEAAGQIGNDFLNFPISSMGNGFGATGGVAYARPVGSWNLGGGMSFRKSTEFAAFSVSNEDFTFTPGDELRLRVGVDRPVGDGQVTLGLSFSAFGSDIADTTTYSTGDRIILNGSWSRPLGGANLFLSAWNLYRLEGERLGGAAPTENVFNVSGALSFDIRSLLVQPGLEGRLWQQDGVRAGNLINLGLRVRWAVGAFALYPQVGYSIGTVYSTDDGSESDISGLRGSLTVRYR
jgi:hypothetical protein